ncbi:L,D-transpeptidase family protein [Pseudobutyrivibrio sp. YE44]|uniref:L,D-transpeptidase family protein n=1 Tax=Pseudobutyrivibrio sp. YE44 TaxID=1520802 RepID=UPI001A9A67CD|nr:L,D-transpeptidase family protein [Pseudobutyrivibrio sp. YE44]
MTKAVKSLASTLMVAVLTFSVFIGSVLNVEAMTDDVEVDVSTTTLLGESPKWIADLPQAKTSSQMLVVAAYGTTTAWVSLNEKGIDGKWRTIMTTPGFIGKNGLGKTKEGDAKTPVGTYGFNAAFGIAPDPGCKIPYIRCGNDQYWSGDANPGMQYNRMVDIKNYPNLDKENSEHIIEYTRHYQYCLNISYNAEGTPGLGSAIFLHCMGPNKPYTGGCVAIPENQMKVVMQNVKPDCTVVIDSLENLGGNL